MTKGQALAEGGSEAESLVAALEAAPSITGDRP